MKVGDLVVRKSYDKDITFKVINITLNDKGEEICELKGVNIRIEADSPAADLEVVRDENFSKVDKVFNKKINDSIKRILLARNDKESEEHKLYANTSKKSKYRGLKKSKNSSPEKELIFGRPGRILHLDGDSDYLEVCLKTYKELSLEAVGKAITEKDQPQQILELVKEIKPDIVVITGHDGMIKGTSDYMNLNNYRNSKYYVDAVKELRSYEPNYDDLVIFAGACQSCYEAILDAGANFASSPNRVLIHCLDPVLVCEKIAYTNIEKIVCIKEVIENTITGIKGIGGLQTRGKYREGFPKSKYIK